MFNELTKSIEELLTMQPNVIVGVSGFAGSGKSTLATKLANYFNVSDGQIVRLDNLYAPMPRGDGMFDDCDWPLLIRILEDAHNGKRIQYQSRGFIEDSVSFDEALPKIIIVEGIQLFRQELMEKFDISVWIDCPLEIALGRAKARDLAQDHDEAYMKRWDTEWGPRNKAYFDTYRPDQLASFLYE